MEKYIKHLNAIEKVIYLIKFAMKNSKIFLGILIIQGICGGANSFIFAYLPPIIIDMLTNKASMKQMLAVMILLKLEIYVLGKAENL